MSARWTSLLAVLLALAGSVAISVSTSSLGDYPFDAGPPIDGLASGDVQAFLTRPPLMGTLSVLVRAPAVALVRAVDGGDLWSYRAGALPCVLAAAALGLALAARLRARDASPAAQLGVVVLALVIAAFSQSLRYGHPEELLGAALCVGAVLLAADGRALLAGAALGLALVTKQWALLAVLPALMAAPAGRVRLAVVAGAVALALTAPSMLASFEQFAAGQQNAANTYNRLMPTNVWWLVGEREQVSVFDGVGHRMVTQDHLSDTLSRVSHPLIVALAVPLGLLVLWRRRWRPIGYDALALLALLFLLRCVLDPVNNIYYHVPMALTLLGYEATVRRGAPLLTLFAALATWLTFDAGVALAEGPRTLAYLGWTLPLAVHLGRLAMGSGPVDSPARVGLGVWRATRA